MPEDYYSTTAPLRRTNGPSLRAIFALVMLAFLGGALLISWLVWDGRIALGAKTAAAPAAQSSFAVLPSPTPSAAANQAATTAGFEARVAALEARLARLDLEAAAAEGNTARAEALMVAFAARRAIERGSELGFLGEHLKLRFGEAKPAALATVLAAAEKPVTLDWLEGELDKLGPALTQAPKQDGGWDRFTRELSGLFVIRRDSAPSASPTDRLDRAKLQLRSGQTDAAIAEVARMPGSAAATAWIAAAQRYAETQLALDQLEIAALLEPERLRSSSGEVLKAPSPAVAAPLPTSQGSL
jgi:hypothetical protein